jgi:hypothetical protein
MPLFPSFPDIQTVVVTGSVVTTAIQSGSYTVIVSGTQSITGTVAIANFPIIQTVTGSVGITGISAITGSVAVVNFPATQTVQGDVSVGNVVSVTGSVAVGNQIFITTTGSLPVSFSGITNVTGTVLALPTGVQTIAGTVTSVITGTVQTSIVGTPSVNAIISGTIMMSTTGALGMHVGNSPVHPLWITTTGSLPVAILSYPAIAQPVTGAVAVNNIVSITGSVSTQASFPTVSGTLGSLNSVVTIPCSNSRTVGGSIRGTWNGVITSEGTVNGTDWFTVWTANKSTNDIINTYTSNDDFEYYSVAGCTRLRLRMTAFTSGLAQITLVGTEAATSELLNYSGPDGDQGPPTRHLSIASMNVDGTLRALKSADQNVSGSETGLITRAFQNEEASFLIQLTDISIGNNKSMVSLLNQGSKRIRIHGVWLTNVQTAAVTGIIARFLVSKITNHSAGTLVTGNAIALDSADILGSGVSIRTGATITGRGTAFWRSIWSTDEWGPGTLDEEGFEHGLQTIFPILQFPGKIKPLTLRPGEGFDIFQNVNSTVGTFDVCILFSEVPI